MLNGGDGPGRTTTTDAGGQFVFEGLRTGRYYVNVTKPGFVSLSYGQRRVNSPGTPIPDQRWRAPCHRDAAAARRP